MLNEVLRPYHCYQRLDKGKYEGSRTKNRMRVLHDETLTKSNVCFKEETSYVMTKYVINYMINF